MSFSFEKPSKLPYFRSFRNIIRKFDPSVVMELNKEEAGKKEEGKNKKED